MTALIEWNFDSAAAVRAEIARAEFMAIIKTVSHEQGDLESCELIFGELIGNVVRHAPGPVKIRLDWLAEYPTLRVHDERQPFKPTFGLPEDPLQESGRGLFIVRSLARSVRVEDLVGDGTIVEAVLPVRRCVGS
jgi:anti-sigma regulatory factor (Ser/Thr protein kinase)